MKAQDIQQAKENFGSFIKTTPLEYSERLSKKYKAEIYLKREDLQKVRSYKIRGAYNLISSLSAEDAGKWVVCASAGNHAQGFALSCNALKIKGTVFMPITTPEQKVYKTKQFGGKYISVQLVWDTFDEAFAASKEFQKTHNATFVHPFDDMKIIEWQATVGLEIYDEITPDYIVCPIGGGGIISGIISATEAFEKDTKIIGVEPGGAPSMKESLSKGKNTALEKIDIFVDGAAVKQVGKNNFKIVQDYYPRVVTCPENRVCSTILEFLKEDGVVVEPAGALATDALKDLWDKIEGKKVVVIVSGGNFDFERLPEVKERSMKYEGLKRYYIVSFPQRPGALRDFLDSFGPDEDIARFEYMKKSNKDKAPVLIGIESTNSKNFEKLEKKIAKMWFKFHDITHDELYFDLLI